MGTYDSYIVDFKNLVTAYEFDIFGDHVADLAIGAKTNHRYCFIEFEDARESSIFKRRQGQHRNGPRDSSMASASYLI